MHVTALNLERGWRGGEHQVFLLTRELMRLGVRQTIIVRRGAPLAGRLKELRGTGIDGEGGSATGAGAGGTPGDGAVADGAVANSAVVDLEIVEVAHAYEAFRRLPRRPEPGGAPLIYHSHTGNTVPVAVLGAGWRHRSVVTRHLDRPVTPWLYARADRVVAVSAGVRETLRHAGIAPERLRLIPTAIDQRRTICPSVAERLRAEYGIQSGRTIGLTIAAMTEEKDPFTPVRALRSLPQDYTHVLVGDGPLRPDVERLAEELGVAERLVLPGFDPLPERWFSVADVFVFPSLWEALGMVALDALFFGVPVVASDIDGTRGLLDNDVTCIRFAPGNAESLAAAIRRMSRESGLAERLVEEGRRKVRDYDVRDTAHHYLELYEDLAGVP